MKPAEYKSASLSIALARKLQALKREGVVRTDEQIISALMETASAAGSQELPYPPVWYLHMFRALNDDGSYGASEKDIQLFSLGGRRPIKTPA